MPVLGLPEAEGAELARHPWHPHLRRLTRSEGSEGRAVRTPRWTWSEHTAGPYTVVVRRTRSGHYTARIYRGRAFAGSLRGLRAIGAFLEEHA